MKKIVTLLAVLAVSSVIAAPSHATDLKGKWGLGYQRELAPVGARFWLSPKVGLDLGVGFQSVSDDNSVVGEKGTSFAFDIGMPYVLASSGNTNFWIRPGVTFASVPNDYLDGVGNRVDNSASIFWVSGDLGVEHFFSDNFSLQAAHGVVFKDYDPGSDQAGTKYSTFETEAFGISSIGFHYYFGGSK